MLAPSTARGPLRRLGRRTRLALGAAIAVTVAGAAPAWAYWTASAATSVTAGVATLAAPATVTAAATASSITSITVTVTAAPASGPTPTGYKIVRNSTTVCASVALNAECVDSGRTPNTTYSYTATALLGSWTSAATASASAKTPVVPAPSTPALTAATDTGTAGDGFTTSTTPAFTGTAYPGSTVTLFVDGTAKTPTATADATTGVWTITPGTAPTTNAAHTVTATATVSGSTSAASSSSSLLIDSVRPTMGTATSGCSAALTNGWCRGTVTVTVPTLADASPSSGIAGVDWSVAGGTSGTAAASGTTATFGITGPDGTPTITYAVRDAAGNKATSRTLTPTQLDNTAVTVTSLQLSNGGTSNKVDAGDRVTIGLSDAASGVNPQSVCSTWSTSGTSQSTSPSNDVTVTITNQGANDVLTVSTTSSCGGAVRLGSIALGADVVSADTTFSGSGSGNRSTIGWSSSNGNASGTLTITLGNASSSSTAVTTTGTTTPVLTPNAALSDLAGNTVSTSPVTGAASRF